MIGLAENTIDNHKSRLEKKLGVPKATELTRLGLVGLELLQKRARPLSLLPSP